MDVVDLVRDVGQGSTHLLLDGVGRQQRLGIHRVEIVDPVEERRLDPVRAQRARDRVEDDGAAEATDVDGAGRRLRVVDDLRARVTDPLRQLVGPILRPMARSRVASVFGARVPVHGRRWQLTTSGIS